MTTEQLAVILAALCISIPAWHQYYKLRKLYRSAIKAHKVLKSVDFLASTQLFNALMIAGLKPKDYDRWS